MTLSHPNRLAQALSPYLLQHAHQPVDWFPWGEEALTKARVEDKPIFLSIGYSACHWCHVMAHESFEDSEVARLLNEHFVPVKVDREERPDLDDLYMEAVQAIGGRGGWPMSVWLLPDLKPFFGGTYFPKESRHGMPGFRPLLQRIVELWGNQRADLERDATRLADGIACQSRGPSGPGSLKDGLFEEALAQLRREFDPEWGGFGPAPKFPAHLAVEVILRRGTDGDQIMARRTLDAMAAGGMRDHLGGGFARYSVDRQWRVPHFEKMLYDNAQLAGCYLSAFQALGDPEYARIARETLDYLLTELQDPVGGFHSSEDADSEGEEGRYYVFRPEEVAAILDPMEADLFCQAFGITLEGNFEHGSSVLHRFTPIEELAERQGLSNEHLESRLERLRAQVLVHRQTRVHPGKDDKIVAAWNGLALSALARGFAILGEARYRLAAERCARFLESELWKEGTLLRVFRQGRAQIPGFLEDYGAVSRGLTDLYEATFEVRWLRLAETLAEGMLQRFEDAREGGFFFTEEGQPDLLHRRKAGWDGAIPAGVTLASSALLRLARHLERDDFHTAAERALQATSPSMSKAPRAFLGLISVLDDFLSEPVELVLAGDPADPRLGRLLAQARAMHLPGLLVSLASSDSSLPLHQGRTAVEGMPTAYLCRSRSCFPPITSPDELRARLSEFFNGRNRPLDEHEVSP